MFDSADHLKGSREGPSRGNTEPMVNWKCTCVLTYLINNHPRGQVESLFYKKCLRINIHEIAYNVRVLLADAIRR